MDIDQTGNAGAAAPPPSMDQLNITHASSPLPSPSSNSTPSLALSGIADNDSSSSSSEDARAAETSAYQALVSDGGRPSHPIALLEDIIFAPGVHRDILSYWQDRTDDWRVFGKQWDQWRDFRTHQNVVREPSRFPAYVKELDDRLKQRGFKFPLSFGDPQTSLRRRVDRQSQLATWIEYINYEYGKRDNFDRWLASCKPGYDLAWEHLAKSGFLHPSENNASCAADLCSPPILQMARQVFETRLAEEAHRDALVAVAPRVQASSGPLDAECPEFLQLREAWDNLEKLENRSRGIAEFKRKTNAYRFALDKAERHDLLLHWMHDQIPLIDHSPQTLPTPRDAPWRFDDSIPRVFHRFQRLAPEIRRKIWLLCLPLQPTAHFFEVVNHPRKRHLARSWSSHEFRVRATRSRDSGYHVVYPLVSSCLEARMVIGTYYKMTRTNSLSGCISVGGYNFSTFDWIPAEDLVILSFPPAQDQLPAEHAITFTTGIGRYARNVGVLFPEELLLIQAPLGPHDPGLGDSDDITQVSVIAEFLQRLREPHHGQHHRSSRQTSAAPPQDNGDNSPASIGGGVANLYFIVDGWEGTPAPQLPGSGESAASADEDDVPFDVTTGRVAWSFKLSTRHEAVVPWTKTGQMPSVSNQRRLHWSVGSANKALVLGMPRDVVQQNPAREIATYSSRIHAACDEYGWQEFVWTQTLGWMDIPT